MKLLQKRLLLYDEIDEIWWCIACIMQIKNTTKLIKKVTTFFFQKPILNILFKSWFQFCDPAYWKLHDGTRLPVHIQVPGFIAKLLSFNPSPPSSFQAARYHPLPPSRQRWEGRLVSPLLTDGVIPQDTLDRLINKSGGGRNGRKRTLLPTFLGFPFYIDYS